MQVQIQGRLGRVSLIMDANGRAQQHLSLHPMFKNQENIRSISHRASYTAKPVILSQQLMAA